MCGIPYHSAQPAISASCLEAGKSIAVCEQTSVPGADKGIVRREVVDVLTPGSHWSRTRIWPLRRPITRPRCSSMPTAARSRPPICLRVISGRPAFDSKDAPRLWNESCRAFTRESFWWPRAPRIHTRSSVPLLPLFPATTITRLPPWRFDRKTGYRRLTEHFGTAGLQAFGLDEQSPSRQRAAGSTARVLAAELTRTLAGPFALAGGVPCRLLPADRSAIGAQSRTGGERAGRQRVHASVGDRPHPDRAGLTSAQVPPALSAGQPAPPSRPGSRRGRSPRSVSPPALEAVRAGGIGGAARRLSGCWRRVSPSTRPRRAICWGWWRTAQGALALDGRSPESAPHSLAPGSAWDDGSRATGRSVCSGRGSRSRARPRSAVDHSRRRSRSAGAGIADLDALRGSSSGSRTGASRRSYLDRGTDRHGADAAPRIRYNKIIGYFFEVTKSKLDQLPAHFKRKQSLVGSERFTTDRLGEIEDALLHAQRNVSTSSNGRCFLR